MGVQFPVVMREETLIKSQQWPLCRSQPQRKDLLLQGMVYNGPLAVRSTEGQSRPRMNQLKLHGFFFFPPGISLCQPQTIEYNIGYVDTLNFSTFPN